MCASHVIPYFIIFLNQLKHAVYDFQTMRNGNF